MSYDLGFAEVYDDVFHDEADARGVVDRLASLLPPGGRALELGVGTGRVGLPLSRRGHDVTGVDVSAAMLERLEAKLGPDDRLEAVRADMATFAPEPGAHDLAYSILGSISCLPDDAACTAALRALRTAVRPGGPVVVESYNPRPILDAFTVLERSELQERVEYPTGRLSSTVRHGGGRAIEIEHTFDGAPGTTTFPESVRLVDPEWVVETMQGFGVTLEAQHGSWSGDAFDPDRSPMYVLTFR